METVAQTIKRITRKHLMENGVLLSQNVTAVGWIGGTVPDDLPDNKGIIELPTSDVSNSGIAVGMALMGRRPIYVVRFQGFMFYNLASLVNYAAKSKEMWNIPCPVFVRALGMEGSIGPVASNMHHGMVMRMPGIPVVAPMTPHEWEESWDFFVTNDDPVYCSESRLSFPINYELPDKYYEDAKVTLFAIANARINSLAVSEQLKCNLVNVMWLKPTKFTPESLYYLRKSKFGIVIDSDFEMAAQSLAYELMHLSGIPVFALGLENRCAGFSADNITPSAEKIISFISRNVLLQ